MGKSRILSLSDLNLIGFLGAVIVNGLARYIGRLPDDNVGKGLFNFAAVAYATISIGFFIQR